MPNTTPLLVNQTLRLCTRCQIQPASGDDMLCTFCVQNSTPADRPVADPVTDEDVRAALRVWFCQPESADLSAYVPGRPTFDDMRAVLEADRAALASARPQGAEGELAVGRERYRRLPWPARGPDARTWEVCSAGTWFGVSEEFAQVLDALASARAALAPAPAPAGEDVERVDFVEANPFVVAHAIGNCGGSDAWAWTDTQHVVRVVGTWREAVDAARADRERAAGAPARGAGEVGDA